MGTRAFSHDSIFIPDGGAESEQTVQAMSQDNILGKVKTLQRQLGKNIRFGQPPPDAIPMKKVDSGEPRFEEDLFLTGPVEVVTQQDLILSDTENKPSETPSSPSPLDLPGARSEMEEKVAPAKPSRPKRHLSSAGTIESVNLDAIPLAIARLDNSAAKHKLSIKPKNQRVSRKHRRLVGDRQNEHRGLPHPPSPDQNGHPGEDKPIWHEREPEPLDSEEEKRRQEEYWRELEAKCKRQKAEAAERRRLEEQRLQALERRLWEENRRQELLVEEKEEEEEEEEGEEREIQLEAEKRQSEEETQSLEEPGSQDPEQREEEEGGLPEAEEPVYPEEEAQHLGRCLVQEEGEARSWQEAEKLRQEEEERELEELRRLEEQGQWAAERQRLEEEERQRELEEEKRMEALRRQEELEAQRWREEEEVRKREELKKREDLDAKRRQEVEKKLQEAPRVEEENQPQLDYKSGLRSPFQSDLAEKAEEQEHPKLEKPRENAEKPSIWVKQSQEATETSGEQPGKQGDVPGDRGSGQQEMREVINLQPPQKPEAPGEEMLAPGEKEAAAPETDRKVEELRWQEVDERQTMPRPYTFQVSSGGKQILFPKVNLSPVKPMKDEGLTSAPQEPKAPKASPASHALPSTLSIPHTAILVTGAQLCGPAVNLSQIKDTACKSLLGLSEEKKPVDVPALENAARTPGEPRAGSAKTRPPPESPSSAAALAEWASIRSRILKSSESDQRGEREQAQARDELTPRGRCDSRGNLRRTPPVNAKFSIKPAWQKFSDGGGEGSRPSAEGESVRKRCAPGPSEEPVAQPAAADTKEALKAAEKPRAHQEPTDTTEGCKFAKDLPSFLVPGLPYPPQKAVAQGEPGTTSDGQAADGAGKPEPAMPAGEDKASLFGIKLRRTNYSLRFHCDQQAEQKKKKRHSSAEDGADGAPAAPGSAHGERETEAEAPRPGPLLPAERKPTPAPWKDSSESPPSLSPPAAQPGPPLAGSQPPAPEQDKAANRLPLAQKPALAPKPAGQTPPSSPLSKVSRPYLVELLTRRVGKPEPEPSERCKEGRDSGWPPSPPPPEERKEQKREKEEQVETERKPASPAPSSGQEKPAPTPEAGRKEKPMLQSRHSLDGSKLVEKAETAQPLWVTLALQKQKGFREQQATREERKQAREAKQAEKLSREHVSVTPQPGSSSVGRPGSLHKPAAQPEEKKPETPVSRLERREQLRKANTLPTSVTVEISDSAPPAPLVKEVTKRFSNPDAAPVSTEPAWLALAKRKAKAWSDCPQIIK
ncbi:capping protein-inhibiting regulator of actin dynamics isoform X1 [Odocoileus virginianus]|uniref:Capping protein-inhibiting regulator of actin dynamics isoform X1 n=1 Tax=Odocoileus virginianus TaxID=9874 RepID=A0A6J0X8U0_ODOVR